MTFAEYGTLAGGHAVAAMDEENTRANGDVGRK